MMKGNTSPRPDGIPLEFYKTHWERVKAEVIKVVQDFFDSRASIKHLNHMAITLILKSLNTIEIEHFSLISCIKIIYKAVSRILAIHLNTLLLELILQN